MNVFLDSGAFIAYHRNQDAHHEAAVKYLDEFSDANTPTFTTSHVLAEVVTYLQAKDGPLKAYEVGHRMLENHQLTVVYPDETRIQQGLEIVRQRKGLSLCDALTAAIMQEEGIEALCSFDADFDQFKHIQRLH